MKPVTISPLKRKLLSFALVCLGALSPLARYLLEGHTLVWRDTSMLFQPVSTLVMEALRQFQLPLWNPYEALGIPLFAQMMHGVLHPVSLVGALLFPKAGMDGLIVAHTVLAAAGAFVLASMFNLSCGAAAVSGLAYGLSGYVLGMSSIIQYLGAASVAPWVLAAFRFAGNGGRYGTVIAAMACAIQWFAGDPQWTLAVFVLGISFAADAGGRRGAKWALLAVLAGTAVASIQIFPTFVYLAETSRGLKLDVYDKIQWPLSPWRLLELWSPGFFGDAGLGHERWPVFMWLGGLTRPGFEMPFVPSIYVGCGTLLCAAAGVSRERTARLLVIACAGMLWLALGDALGADVVGGYLPVWNKFRYAEKMVGPFTLCLALLAGFGAQRLAQRPRRAWWLSAATASLLCFFSSLAIARWWSGEGLADSARLGAVAAGQNAASGLLHAGLGLAALAVLIAAAERRPGWRTFLPGTAAVIVCVQLWAASGFALHPGQRGIVDTAPLARLRAGGELVRIVTPVEKLFLFPPGLDEEDGQAATFSHLGRPAYNVPARLDQFETYTGLTPGRFEALKKAFSQYLGPRSVQALRRYGVSHAVIKTPYSAEEAEIAGLASAGGHMVLSDPAWNFTVWQVPHRPWAAFAGDVVTARDADSALQELIRVAEHDGDARTVVLEGTGGRFGTAPGRVLATKRDNGHIKIEAVAEGEGVLVVNDSYWPGWRASIDGKAVDIFRADYLVRAVKWPAGKHVLEMTYDPAEVKAGGVASMVGLAFCGLLLVLEFRRLRNCKHARETVT